MAFYPNSIVHLFEHFSYPNTPVIGPSVLLLYYTHILQSQLAITLLFCESSLALNLISVDTHIFRPWHGCLFQG